MVRRILMAILQGIRGADKIMFSTDSRIATEKEEESRPDDEVTISEKGRKWKEKA